MADGHETVGTLLGTPVDRTSPVRVHTYAAPGELDYEVVYAAVDLAEADARALLEHAGLTGPEAVSFARVMLPGGWNIDPGSPPAWWPEPTVLRDQAARSLPPNGWLLCGYQDGTLYVLATRTPAG
ncbi:hypothetical protein ACWDWO_13460 [Actinopolymorpha singaporensis]|uniref:Uncharacterized protein n=1 Tax=Actinopolymorpha singaporensis TaxID=117157 RepID=A0A1H1UYC8_9ACTN|nr:hypothetical protein [Actinopolymorpha singaporensis]SDS77271.1 hypothetical protein SAMN04489717_3819 [Actinopolymorpha singaporensis]